MLKGIQLLFYCYLVYKTGMGLLRCLFPLIPITGRKHTHTWVCSVMQGDGDEVAAGPNYRIICKSSSIFLSPGFQLTELLYS